jgi:tetratricopeptide (TPR) repeat protein
VSILLEILGRGLEEDLRVVLYPLYGGGSPESVQALSTRIYEDACPQHELALGLACWREGQLDEARRRLVTLCYREPTARAALAAMAAICAESGDTLLAADFLGTLSELEPEAPAVAFARGFVDEQLDHPARAAGHYGRVVELDPHHVSGHKRLAAVQLRLGWHRKACATYEALREIVPEDGYLRTSLACLQFHCTEYRDAAESFEVIVAMEPENWAVEDETIMELVQRGQFREAIQIAERLLEDQGGFPDLHLQVANLYSLVGDDEPALHQYHQALHACPSYLEALIKLATHHMLFKRWEEAAEVFGQAALCSERLLINYIGLGISQAAAGDIPRAAHTLDLASAIDPNSTLLLTQMIRLHRRLAQALAAQEPVSGVIPPGEPVERVLEPELRCHLDRVTRRPLQAEGHFHLGVLLRSLGQARQAASEFARAVRLHPAYVPPLVKLGLALKELEHDRLAARVFHRLFSVPEQQIEAYYRLAVTFTINGRIDQLAERLAGNHPERSLEDVRADLALSLQHMGLLDRSAGIWRALIETHRV